ncbi:MAG: AsmA family protein [candidate division Zixibacteria bacterium]|nr:AsmA family protein [candidate division Zixibacteria bacterium]
MNRLKKIILWSLIVIVGLIIILIAGVSLFFPKEKAKAMAIEKISAALERKVAIDDVSLSFWGGLGIYLEGIKIPNPPGFSGPGFLSAEALDVKVAIFPLLKKEVQISRLILKEPRIFLHKLPDGSSNFKFGAAGQAAPEEVAGKMSEESKMAALAISYDNLNVQNGRVDYIDDSSGMKITMLGLSTKSRMKMPRDKVYDFSGTIGIDSLHIATPKAKFPTLNIAADYRAVANLQDGNLVVSQTKITINGVELKVAAGIPNLKTMQFINAELVADKTDISNLLSLLPDTAKALLAPYKVSGQVALSGTAKYNKAGIPAVSYDGKAAFTDLKLSQREIAGELVLNSARTEFRNNYLKFDIEKGSFDNNPLEGTLAISDFSNPQVVGRFKGRVNLAFLNPFLPKTGSPKVSGDMQFDIGARGSVKDLTKMQLAGTLAITNAAYSSTTLPEPIESFSMDVRMTPESMTINSLNMKFPSSDFALTGTMTDPFPYILPKYAKYGVKPDLNFKMKSRRFDTDKLFPAAVPGSGINPTAVPLDSLPTLLLPDINGTGDAVIDTLIYSKVEFTKITGDIAIKDRKVFVTGANGNVYSGRVTGEAEIDLNDFDNPKYAGKYDATQVEANDFLTRFTKFGGHLFGKLNMTGDFAATGWEPEALINSLSMDGLATINEAKLVNFDLLKQLAQNFNFKAADEEVIKEVVSKFKVERGRIVFDGLKFLSSIGDWNVAGSVGFDGTLDYMGEVLLSQSVSTNLMSQSGLVSSFAGLFKESQTGRVKVPFRLGGSYSNPRVNLDLSVKDKMKDNLKGKFDSAIQNLLKKK